VTAAAVGRTEAPAVAFLAALGVGCAIGLANGLLVAGVRINPFIATIGTGFILGGITLVATGNVAYTVDNPGFATIGAGRWHGFPYSGMILVACLCAGGLVLARTVYGQAVYAVGGNAEASRLSGIRVGATIGSTYVLSGLSMGVAGSITASQLSSAQANINPDIVFDVITIVVVGGTSLTGGVGSMWRTAIGLGSWARSPDGFANGLDRFLSVPSHPLVAASGAWTAPDTFTVKIAAYETPFSSTLSLRFDGDRLLLESEHNVAFGPTKLPPLVGQRRK